MHAFRAGPAPAAGIFSPPKPSASQKLSPPNRRLLAVSSLAEVSPEPYSIRRLISSGAVSQGVFATCLCRRLTLTISEASRGGRPSPTWMRSLHLLRQFVFALLLCRVRVGSWQEVES